MEIGINKLTKEVETEEIQQVNGYNYLSPESLRFLERDMDFIHEDFYKPHPCGEKLLFEDELQLIQKEVTPEEVVEEVPITTTTVSKTKTKTKAKTKTFLGISKTIADIYNKYRVSSLNLTQTQRVAQKQAEILQRYTQPKTKTIKNFTETVVARPPRTKAPSTNITPSGELLDKTTPKFYFSPRVFKEIMYAIKYNISIGNGEISGGFLYQKVSNTHPINIIYDWFLVPQETTGVHTEIDMPGWLEAKRDILKAHPTKFKDMLDLNNHVGHWHSHPGMCVRPSGTDDAEYESESQMGFESAQRPFLILNESQNIWGCYCVYDPIFVRINNIHIGILTDEASIINQEHKKELTEEDKLHLEYKVETLVAKEIISYKYSYDVYGYGYGIKTTHQELYEQNSTEFVYNPNDKSVGTHTDEEEAEAEAEWGTPTDEAEAEAEWGIQPEYYYDDIVDNALVCRSLVISYMMLRNVIPMGTLISSYQAVYKDIQLYIKTLDDSYAKDLKQLLDFSEVERNLITSTKEEEENTNPIIWLIVFIFYTSPDMEKHFYAIQDPVDWIYELLMELYYDNCANTIYKDAPATYTSAYQFSNNNDNLSDDRLSLLTQDVQASNFAYARLERFADYFSETII